MNTITFQSYNIINPKSEKLTEIANYIIEHHVRILPLKLRDNMELFNMLLDKYYYPIFEVNFNKEVFANASIDKIADYYIRTHDIRLPEVLKDNAKLINKLLQEKYFGAITLIETNPSIYERLDKDILAAYLCNNQYLKTDIYPMRTDALLCNKLIDLKHKEIFNLNFDPSVYTSIGKDKLSQYIIDTQISIDLPDYILKDIDLLTAVIGNQTPANYYIKSELLNYIIDTKGPTIAADIIKNYNFVDIPQKQRTNIDLLKALLKNNYQKTFECNFNPELYNNVSLDDIKQYIIDNQKTSLPAIIKFDQQRSETMLKLLIEANYPYALSIAYHPKACKDNEELIINCFFSDNYDATLEENIQKIIFSSPIANNQENILKVAKYIIKNNINYLLPAWSFTSSKELFNYLYEADYPYLLTMTFSQAIYDNTVIEKLQDYYQRHPQELKIPVSNSEKLKIVSHEMEKVKYSIITPIVKEQSRKEASKYIRNMLPNISYKICKSIIENGVGYAVKEYKDIINAMKELQGKPIPETYQLFSNYYNNPSEYEAEIQELIRDLISKLKEKYADQLTESVLGTVKDEYTKIDEEANNKKIKKKGREVKYLKIVRETIRRNPNDNQYINKIKELNLLDLGIEPSILIAKILNREEVIDKKLVASAKRVEKQKELNRLKNNYQKNLNKLIENNINYKDIIIAYLNSKIDMDELKKYISAEERTTLKDIRDICINGEIATVYENGEVIFTANYVLKPTDYLNYEQYLVFKKSIDQLNNFLHREMNSEEMSRKIEEIRDEEKVSIEIPKDIVLDADKIGEKEFTAIMKLLLIRDKYQNDTYKKIFDKLFVEGGALYALPFLNSETIEELTYVTESIDIVAKAFNENDININNISNIIKKVMIYRYADISDLTILGEEVIKKVAYNDSYMLPNREINPEERRKKRIKLASKYISLASKKTISTIPYVDVEVDGIKVERYHSTESDILTCGIDTNSCFRTLGADNDFLLYTLFNKNGIVIKITDEENNLIGKCSGFRNGNILYFNQPRTIFADNDSSKETNEVIERFRKAIQAYAKKIIEETKTSPEPIEHILILKSHGYNSDEELPVVDKDIIDFKPMNTDSPDYREYVNDEETEITSEFIDYGFTTDYSTSTEILLLASTEGKEIKSKDDIKAYDASAIYDRPRKKVKIYQKADIIWEVINQINKINAKNIYWGNEEARAKKKQEFTPITNLDNIELVILGEDYYLMTDSMGNTYELCLPYDKRAQIEFDQIKEEIITNKKKNLV